MYCKSCFNHIEQQGEKAIGSGEWQTVWSLVGGDWVCAVTGEEHEPADAPLDFTLVVTQEVAYYDRPEETLDEILEAVESGEWETKHNEVVREHVKVYLNEADAEDGKLIYDSGSDE